MPKSLDDSIFRSSIRAQKNYQKLSGGLWLHDGPESFLQYEIVRAIAKDGYVVTPEDSPRKIRNQLEKPGVGRPPTRSNRRFDIVVWKLENSNFLKAIIEIKKYKSIAPLLKDAVKIEKYIKKTPVTGYLVSYTRWSRDKNRAPVEKRGEALDAEIEKRGWRLINRTIRSPANVMNWSWMMSLHRFR